MRRDMCTASGQLVAARRQQPERRGSHCFSGSRDVRLRWQTSSRPSPLAHDDMAARDPVMPSPPVALHASCPTPRRTRGGNTTNGVVFSFNVSTNTVCRRLRILWNGWRCAGRQAAWIVRRNLYGTSTSGGPSGKGEVFIGGVPSSAAPLRGGFQGLGTIH
jgi:hypothetical protein